MGNSAKSPRRACLKSTIKHTLGLVQDSAWAGPPFPPTHTVMQTGWMDGAPFLTQASLATPQGVNAVSLHTAKQRGAREALIASLELAGGSVDAVT